jgi:hypothetical protein
MVSKILIEYEEELGNFKTLRLIVDGQLIAENLSPKETQRLIFGVLERIAVLDVEEDAAQPWAKEVVGTRRHSEP